MAAPTETPNGYRVQIHQSVWKRVTMLGAPKMVAVLWLAICLQAALLLLPLAGFRWAGAALGVWCLGQAVLVGLTMWDDQWDELAQAQLFRRYAPCYEGS
jgi:type IV secretory pathway TrbD component